MNTQLLRYTVLNKHLTLPLIPRFPGFERTGRTKGFHPTPLARLVSDGHTRFVVLG
jgi:hypothetical protein